MAGDAWHPAPQRVATALPQPTLAEQEGTEYGGGLVSVRTSIDTYDGIGSSW